MKIKNSKIKQKTVFCLETQIRMASNFLSQLLIFGDNWATFRDVFNY